MPKAECDKCGGDGWYLVHHPDHRGEHALDVVDCDCEVKKDE
jgi:hypothetical protein